MASKGFKSLRLERTIKIVNSYALLTLQAAAIIRRPMLINSRVLLLVLRLLLRITIMLEGVFSSDQTIIA